MDAFSTLPCSIKASFILASLFSFFIRSHNSLPSTPSRDCHPQDIHPTPSSFSTSCQAKSSESKDVLRLLRRLPLHPVRCFVGCQSSRHGKASSWSLCVPFIRHPSIAYLKLTLIVIAVSFAYLPFTPHSGSSTQPSRRHQHSLHSRLSNWQD